MSDQPPRRLRARSNDGRFMVEVDHDLCSGFGDCVREAPAAFALDDDNLAVILDPDAAGIEALTRAADACPVSAILLFGPDGARLAPDV